MEKEKFARLVGEQIDAAAARDEFDELLLGAATRTPGAAGRTGSVARAKLVGTLEKDLVKTPDHELWPHVREWAAILNYW